MMDCTYFLSVDEDIAFLEVKPVAVESIVGMPKRINRSISAHERAIQAYETKIDDLRNKMMETEHHLKHQMKSLEGAIIHQGKTESERFHNMVNQKLARTENRMTCLLEKTVGSLRAECQKEQQILNSRMTTNEKAYERLRFAYALLMENL